METLQSAAQAYIANLAAPRCNGLLSANSQRLYKSYAQAASAFFGATPLADVRLKKVRPYVDSIRHLSPISISLHIQVLQAIVSFETDDDGVALFPQQFLTKAARKTLALPKIKKEEQKRPVATQEQVEAALPSFPLVAFLSASGLRASEALALKIEDADGDSYEPSTGIIHIRKTLKRPSARRDVVLPASFAEWFNSYAPSSGALFPLSYQQIHSKLGASSLPTPHAYRRFRASWMRKQRVQEDVLRAQLGHAAASVTDTYSNAGRDLEFVRSEVERCGVGFKFAA
ncbi:MAG TPA: site-specific integrase [Candidatus Dormibacteraeota bacterium]|nr:site-specific integrase [Candidatus Dormibacteraeota bacterium]